MFKKHALALALSGVLLSSFSPVAHAQTAESINTRLKNNIHLTQQRCLRSFADDYPVSISVNISELIIKEAGAQCYTFKAPENYKQPESDLVDMFFSIHPARDPDKRKGILFLYKGSPSSSAEMYSTISIFLKKLPQKIIDQFDIIGLDPRGTGQSAFAHNLETCTNPGETSSHFKDNKFECDVTELNFKSSIGTHALVQDMDRLRDILGEEKISFLGSSYGTRVGALYASKYPERSRAIILDSPMKGTSNDMFSWDTDKPDGTRKHMQYLLKKSGLAKEEGLRFLKKLVNSETQDITPETMQRYQDYFIFDYKPIMQEIQPEVIETYKLTKMTFHGDYVVLNNDNKASVLPRTQLFEQVTRGSKANIIYSKLIDANMGQAEKNKILRNVFRFYTDANAEIAHAYMQWFAEQGDTRIREYLKSPIRIHAINKAILCTDQTPYEQAQDKLSYQYHPNIAKNPFNINNYSAEPLCTGWERLGETALDSGPKLGSLETPVLIVGSEFDAYTPITWYHDMKSVFPNAFSIFIKNGIGHAPLFYGERLPLSSKEKKTHYSMDKYAENFLLYADQPNAKGSLLLGADAQQDTERLKLQVGQEMTLNYHLHKSVGPEAKFYERVKRTWYKQLKRAKKVNSRKY